jgi:hypothetical protein
MPLVTKSIPLDLKADSNYIVRLRSLNAFGVPSDWSESLVINTTAAGLSEAQRFVVTANGMIAYNNKGEIVFFYSSVPAIRTNLVRNPSFELGTTGWTALAQSIISRSTSDFYVGEQATLSCLKIVANPTIPALTAVGVGVVSSSTRRIAVTPGLPYSLSLFVKVPSGQDPVKLKIGLRFYTAGGVLISESLTLTNADLNSGNSWVRLNHLGIIAPSGAASLGVVVITPDVASDGEPLATGQFWYVDGVMVEQETTLREYFDGSTSAGTSYWNVPANPHDSTSSLDTQMSYSVNGGVFTESTIQTARNVDLTGGVIMDIDGVRGYNLSGGLVFNLDSVGNLSLTGSVTAIAGVIGGFTIGANSLTAGTGSNAVGLNTTGYPFYAGDSNPSAAPFSVGSDGTLVATAASISGTLTAGLVQVGVSVVAVGTNGVSIDSSYNNAWVQRTADNSIYFRAGNATNFILADTQSGSVQFSNGTFAGNITSSATITGGTIQTAASGNRVVMSGASFNVISNTGLGAAKITLTSSGNWLNVIESVNGGLWVRAWPGHVGLESTIELGNSLSAAEFNVRLANGVTTTGTLRATLGEFFITGNCTLQGARTYYAEGNTTGGIVGGHGFVGRTDNNSNNWHVNWTGGALDFYIDTTRVFTVDQNTHISGGTLGGAAKSFVIAHPTKEDKYLVHACAEGPTSDVFYRGEGQLRSGICRIQLPDYFEALTEQEGRSVQITPTNLGSRSIRWLHLAFKMVISMCLVMVIKSSTGE